MQLRKFMFKNQFSQIGHPSHGSSIEIHDDKKKINFSTNSGAFSGTTTN